MEFLVRAHDCYTLGCSVGGIADLLVTAQSTTTKLVAGKHFKLMVGIILVLCFLINGYGGILHSKHPMGIASSVLVKGGILISGVVLYTC